MDLATTLTGFVALYIFMLAAFTGYEIIGRVPAIFEFIARHGPVDAREMYATFNMGAGFAVYVAPRDADACLRIARETGLAARRIVPSPPATMTDVSSPAFSNAASIIPC